MAADRRSGEPAERVELIDPFADAASTEVVDRVALGPGHGSRTTVATLVGGVVIVAGLLWLLGRGASDPVDADDPLAGRSVDSATVDGGAGDAADTPPPSVTITRAPSSSSSVVVDAPVLGQRSGLSLFYGGEGPLQSLDLDTGALTRYGLDAHPVLVTGRELVLYRENAGIVGWVPLDDPGQQVMTWKRGQVAPGSGPGLLWVLDPETDEPHPEGLEVGEGRWELFDVVRNRITIRFPADLHPEIEERVAGDEPIGGLLDAIRPGPFFSTRTDGVYLSIDGGFQRLATGRLLAHDRDTVLVGRCPPDLAGVTPCELTWFDVETGAELDRPVPEVRPRVVNFVAGGNWLHTVAWDGTSELLELASGRRIVHTWATDRPTLSPDGRWLAEWFGTTVVISDLEGDGPPRNVGSVQAFEREGPGSLLFVRTN